MEGSLMDELCSVLAKGRRGVTIVIELAGPIAWLPSLTIGFRYAYFQWLLLGIAVWRLTRPQLFAAVRATEPTQRRRGMR